VPNVTSLSNADLSQQIEDTVWASDRKFFEQHPQRKFRLRPAFAVEIEEFNRRSPLGALPEGSCWWVAVYCIHPQARQRIPFGAPHHLPAESTEAEARKIWNRVAHPVWKEHAKLCEDIVEEAKKRGEL
jgi:hypothetical protein